MTLTLVCDHRILYGADAAQLLARIRALLESPLGLALGAPAQGLTEKPASRKWPSSASASRIQRSRMTTKLAWSTSDVRRRMSARCDSTARACSSGVIQTTSRSGSEVAQQVAGRRRCRGAV